ncbi:MAG: thioredoxin family protein [Planctomycetota bacterium]
MILDHESRECLVATPRGRQSTEGRTGARGWTLRNLVTTGLTLLGLLGIGNGRAVAADPIAPGTPAPAWNSLPGVDGKPHSLADISTDKIVVVAFTCNSCPFAVAYEDRFIDFAKEYGAKGVEFVAINVNNEEADGFPMMQSRAKEKGFNFPYLHDSSQKIGHAYGARVTPHLYVLDRDRKIAYVGAFDNARKPEKVTKKYLHDAVDALLKGQSPAVPKTNAAGCSIRYEEEG